MEQSRGAGAKRRKIETGIGALDLLELLLGFLQVLHAAGGGAFVWVPSHGELPVGDLQLGVGALLLEPEDRVEVAAGLPGRRRRVAALLCPGIHAVIAGDVKLLRHARTGAAMRCPVPVVVAFRR
jgi:hypothetical protein